MKRLLLIIGLFFSIVSFGQETGVGGAMINASKPDYFGDGLDGAVSITTNSQTIGTWLSAGAMTRDVYCTNLTISGTGLIKTSGYRIFVSGTLDLSSAPSGAITFNGNAGSNAVSATGASAPSAQAIHIIGGTQTAGAGATATTSAGAQAATVSAPTCAGGISGNGGAGGAGSNAGGATRTASTPTYYVIHYYRIETYLTGTTTFLSGGGGGVGGSSGGGDGTNSGGGGGSGGNSGGCIIISANIIYRGAALATGVIQAKGGLGGNGFSTTVGNTGGGGGGGYIYIVANQLTGTQGSTACDVSGGTGGNGGSGFGTGVAGSGGYGGAKGTYTLIVLGSNTNTTQVYGNNVANSGATGGTGQNGQVPL